MNYSENKHINNILKKLDENNYKGMIIADFNNIQYLTGYLPTSFAFLVLNENPTVYVADMDMEIAEKTSKVNIEKFISFTELLSNLEKGDYAIESNLLVDYYLKFNNDLNLKVENYVNEERMIKSDNEIDLIDKALNIAHKSLLELDVRDKQIKGLSEWELAYELGYLMRENGASCESFDTIVASGENSSLPHSLVSNKQLDPHILIDFGCKYKGYCSDTTRTYPYTERENEIFDIVLEAYNTGVKSVKTGIKACEVDKKVRDVITEYGYGDKFIHSTGHSLGLDIHELPSVSIKSNTILEDNMVITIEPGIYLKGEFGVRIEDTVQIKSQANVLGNLPLKL